jgi:hypothetical protein
LVVRVEFETPDGRTFDDAQLVKVHPSPEALAKRPRSHRLAPEKNLATDEADGVRPTGRVQTSRKPPSDDADGDDRPRTPHSVNWTDETIPRLR